MNKRLLAGGDILVWQEEDKTVIHHKNGLTLQLTAEETQDLKMWLNEQDVAWAERAEWLDRQHMEQEKNIS